MHFEKFNCQKCNVSDVTKKLTENINFEMLFPQNFQKLNDSFGINVGKTRDDDDHPSSYTVMNQAHIGTVSTHYFDPSFVNGKCHIRNIKSNVVS